MPLDGVGFPLTTANSPLWSDNIALAAGSDGRDFVVVSRSGSVVTSALVAADSKHHVNDAALPPTRRAALVWLGSEYALVYVPQTPLGVIRYVLLDRAGVQISAPRDLITTANYVFGLAAAIGHGSTFAVAWVDYSDGRVHVVQAPVDGVRNGTLAPMVAAYGLPHAEVSASDVAITSDGQGYLCVWTETGTPPAYDWSVYARSLTAAGLPDGNAMNLGAIKNASRASIAFDGSSYNVAFYNPDGRLVTVAIHDRLAQPVVTQPIAVAWQWPAASVASTTTSSLLFWKSPTQQMMAAPFPVLVVGPSNPGNVISLGTVYQSGIHAVWCGDHYLVVWGEASTLVYKRFDGNGNPLDAAGLTIPSSGSYALATDGDKSLITWSDGSLKAVSIDRNGRATTPAILSPNAVYSPPVIAWNGKEYVALWTEKTGNSGWQTVGVRIGRDGNLIGYPRVVASPALDALDVLIPINDGYYAFVETRTYFCFPDCHPPSELWLGFLSPDLTLIGGAELLAPARPVGFDWGYVNFPFFAKRGADVLLVWAQQSEPDWAWRIHGARLSGAGLVIDRPGGFAIAEGASVTGVIATPEGFTVVAGAAAWDVSSDARTITPTTAYAFVPPSSYSLLVPSGPRPLIIYQHSQDEQHDVPYFVGVFPPLRRSRAVRP